MTGGWRAIRLCDGVLHPPAKGVVGIVFVVVLASPKSEAIPQNNEEVDSSEVGVPPIDVLPSDDGLAAGRCSSDGYKRKLEDQEGPRASKNPRSHSPDNYVRKFCILTQSVMDVYLFIICLCIDDTTWTYMQ